MLIAQQQNFIYVVFNNLKNFDPESTEPFYIQNKLAPRNIAVFMLYHHCQKLHKHGNRIYDIVDFFVVLQLVIYLHEVRHIQNVNLLHQAIVLFLRPNVSIEARVRDDVVKKASNLIHCA